MKSRVLSSFRDLLRAQRGLFGRDIHGLVEAFKKTRGEYLKHSAESDSKKIEQLLKNAIESKKFIEECLVQAVNDPGSSMYKIKFTEKTHKIRKQETPVYFANDKKGRSTTRKDA